MATRAEQIRKRLQQGEEAKERVLSGMYNQPKPSTPMANPRTQAIRNYVPPDPAGTPMPELMQSFPNMNPLNSSLIRGVMGDQTAQKTWEQASGMKFEPTFGPPPPPQVSEYEKGLQAIEGNRPDGFLGNLYDYTVGPFAKANNWLWYGNPVGQFTTRTIGSGGSMILGTPSARPATTGNPIADKAADITGMIGGVAGMAFNPAAAGVQGQNLITGPLNVARNVLGTGVGQKAQRALSYGINSAMPAIKTSTANRIAQAGLEGAMTGAIGGAATGLVQGQDSGQEIMRNTLLGAGLGAAGDALVTGAAAGINKFRASRMPDISSPPAANKTPDIAPISSRPAAAAVDNIETANAMQGNWFTNLFGDRGVGISAFGSNKRVNAGPLTTADQIVRNSIKNDAQGVTSEVAATARAAYQNFVDRLSPLKKISPQAYDAAMDATRSNNIANTIIRDKFVNPEGTVIGEGLNNIFKKVARGQDKSFVDYLTLRHARTRVARGERVYAENLGMTPETIQARIEMYDKRHPGFSQIAEEWDKFNDNVLQEFGVNEGLITQEMKDQLREMNPNYSPMRRQFSRSEKPGKKFLAKTTNSSFSGQKAPLKKVSPTGSVRDIVDPRKTTVEMVGSWTNAAMNNRVMQEMVRAITKDPDRFKGVAEIVKKPKDKTDLRQLLFEGGMDDFAEAINDDFKNLFKTTRLDQDNIVRAMIDGQPVYLQVYDPEVVKTLIGMGPQASNVLLDVATAFSNATKRGATGALAPVFAVKGATMDLVQAAIQAKNPAKQAAYTVYGIMSGIGDRLNIPGLRNMAQEFRRAGGEYSAALKGDRKLNRNISDMTRDPLLSPKGIAKGVKKTIAAPFKALEAVGDIAENAPRMAAFKQELDRLGERTPENVRQAMNSAREVTVNFSRRGAMSRDIEAFIPYNNAAVQGTYRVMSAFKKNPVRTGLAVAALSVMPKLYEYAQFHDDPDYQKLPARERYRFLFVNKNEDGTFTKIPMEPAYNSFGELTISALRQFKDNDPTAFKDSMDALANVWLPPVATGALQGLTQSSGLEGSIEGSLNATIAAPAVAVTANKSFTGAPIESRSLENYSPENRYDERTSSVAIQLGKVMNMSPKKIDYLIRAYGGDPARLLLPLTSQQGAGNARNALLKNFIVDPEFTNTLSTDFYNAKDKLNQAHYDAQDGRGEVPSWYSEDLRKMVTSTAKGSVSKRLSILNSEKRAAGSDKSLTTKQRADKQREIQRKINEIYIDVNQRLEEAGVPLK
ncbi:LPD38 domain-containing protein [Paenibacillus dakarensis]|uniref:LPD38 domain-containing protein n=1 Tax=Paenibacillus dakarensis TaxID=1527293 RepID=UPI0006D56623|nr:LPD38 domain-containing protein [Paenibacillus dakarensis]